MTKYHIYNYINNEYKLKTLLLNKKKLNNNYDYPFIIKPVYCNGSNNGVSLIKSKYELTEYLSKSCDNYFMIQEYYYPKYEVGVLYEKLPFNQKGEIISIVLKNKDSKTWKPVKCKNISNNETINCDNITNIITPELTKTINNISNNIPNFYAGRYDIGFDNFDDLKNGKNFKIYELNGVMGFDLRFLYTDKNLLNNISKTILLIRWTLIRILIGFINLLSLNINLLDILKNTNNRYNDAVKCNNFGKLIQPSSA
jgi:glutathione synthase/RimK-type ligase-like ATP-grasp enzyme